MPGTYLEQAKIVSDDIDRGQGLHAVALSADGSTLLFGSWVANGYAGGAVVWVRVGSSWEQQAVLFGGSDYAGFGRSVALSDDGDTAIVGAPYSGMEAPEDINGAGKFGAAVVFTRDAGVWSEEQTLLGDEGGAFRNHFGWAVALSGDGDTAAVGDHIEDELVGASAVAKGAVYAFVRSGGSWSQEAKISGETGDALGTAVAVADGAGDLMLATAVGRGSSGALITYERVGGSWGEIGDIGGEASGFGLFMGAALDGSKVIVSGLADDGAWIYNYNGSGSWELEATLAPGPYDDQLAWICAISRDGSVALIGPVMPATDDLPAGLETDGGTYVFRFIDPAWAQEGAAILPGDHIGDATVGSSVAADQTGATIAFGGYTDNLGAGDDETALGAVWVYELDANAIEIGYVSATTIVRGIRIRAGAVTVAITFDDLSVQGG